MPASVKPFSKAPVSCMTGYLDIIDWAINNPFNTFPINFSLLFFYLKRICFFVYFSQTFGLDFVFIDHWKIPNQVSSFCSSIVKAPKHIKHECIMIHGDSMTLCYIREYFSPSVLLEMINIIQSRIQNSTNHLR